MKIELSQLNLEPAVPFAFGDSYLASQMQIGDTLFHVTAFEVRHEGDMLVAVHNDFEHELDSMCALAHGQISTVTINNRQYALRITPHAK